MSREIRWQNSRSEHRIPLIDGKACHSLVDPIREAQKWATQVSDELRAPIRRVFVLGGGAGYHVEALLALSEKSQFQFVVVEKEIELASLLRRKLSTNVAGEIQIFDEGNVALGALCPTGLTPASTVAFMFAGAVQAYPDFYFECRRQILAQTQESWDQNLKVRINGVSRPEIFSQANAHNHHPVQSLIQDHKEHDAISAALLELFA